MKHSMSFALGAICSLSVMVAGTASAQNTYRVVPVPDGGAISGSVKWSGERPKILTLPITKDNEVCDPEKTGVRNLERIEIGAEGGVQNTVVYLKNVTAGKAWDLPDTRRMLDQRRCRYVPHVLLVQAGSDVALRSSDPILHTIHMAGAADYNLPFPMVDVTLSRPLRKAGIIDLKCNAGHIWMNGVIVVVDSPYYAVTDDRGDFHITGVPPGEYEIVAWHEGWRVAREEPVLDVGTQTKTKRLFFTDPVTWQKRVTVTANGRASVDFQMSER
jgi:hypothetical protein